MIEKLYSEFDTDITIRVKEGKRFHQNRIDFSKIDKLGQIENYSSVLEEVVILKHEDKWVNANLIAVQPTFLKMRNMDNHIVDGKSYLSKKGKNFAIIGATLLDKLDGYVPQNIGNEMVVCYVPKTDLKIRPGKSPFIAQNIMIAGRMNFNREVNSQYFIVPLNLGKELLNTNDHLSAIYIDARKGVDNEKLKTELAAMVGADFEVKTNFEKNELIYKTSKSEKIIVMIILLFIFILAAFNLVASLTMLFVEKIKDVATLESFGASIKLIFRIFFIEGLLIAGKGILFGMIVGYGVCLLQVNFALIEMPNSGGEPFPILISIADGVLIFSLVTILSVIFSYLPVKYLIKRNLKG